MQLDPRTPVIVGVGQITAHTDQGEPEREPTDLMAEALVAAGLDAGSSQLIVRLDAIAVVPTFSWRYVDPARLVADRVGASRAATWLAAVGGNAPQALVNRLASQILAGDIVSGAVVGAEAFATRHRANAEGRDRTWVLQDESLAPSWLDPTANDPIVHDVEIARLILAPTQTYPLFENALRHESGRTMTEHLSRVGAMWSGFSKVAATNPYAWRQQSFSAEEITTPSADNRMVGWPYTKRMTSNPFVDMGAAIVVCSLEHARSLGISDDAVVFIHAGTDGYDPFISERPDFTSSSAISVAGNRALALAGVDIDEVAHLDLYSCFPSAVQLAIKELGVDESRQLTVYGGLSFAGGPWNNPVSHAIASMVNVLREDRDSVGFVTANGGNVQKHAFGVYSTKPSMNGFRYEKPQAEIDLATPRTVDLDYTGDVEIETFTVMHDRNGVPERAHAATLTHRGVRVWGVTRDPALMKELLEVDPIGEKATISDEGELRLR